MFFIYFILTPFEFCLLHQILMFSVKVSNQLSTSFSDDWGFFLSQLYISFLKCLSWGLGRKEVVVVAMQAVLPVVQRHLPTIESIPTVNQNHNLLLRCAQIPIMSLWLKTIFRDGKKDIKVISPNATVLSLPPLQKINPTFLSFLGLSLFFMTFSQRFFYKRKFGNQTFPRLVLF